MIDDESLKSIENLHRLKGEGIITEEEFEQSKQRILFGQAKRTTTPAGTLPGLPSFTGQLPAIDDHVGWIMLPLRRYADFTGRSTRREFWMFQLIYVVLGLLFLVTMGAAANGDGGGSSVMFGFTIVVVSIALLGLLVPLLAVEARRLHDQDRSGWLVLINLVPYVGVLAILVLMLLEGTRGPNQYGPDPLGR